MKNVVIITMFQSINVTCDDESADALYKSATDNMGGMSKVAWKGPLGEGAVRASQIVGVTINDEVLR